MQGYQAQRSMFESSTYVWLFSSRMLMLQLLSTTGILNAGFLLHDNAKQAIQYWPYRKVDARCGVYTTAAMMHTVSL